MKTLTKLKRNDQDNETKNLKNMQSTKSIHL